MRAISIQQPWAWAIKEGLKPVENRSRAVTHKLAGKLAIHATTWRKKNDLTDAVASIYDACGTCPAYDAAVIPVGGIIATVTLIGCIKMCEDGFPVILWHSHGRREAVDAACESPFFTGEYGWVFADVVPVPFFPFKGAQGFFNVPDEAVQRRAALN